MKCCIDLVSHADDTHLRLQKDGTWVRCPQPYRLLPGDYTSTDRKEIIDFQKSDRPIMLDGHHRLVFPTGKYHTDEDMDLYYDLYGFHDTFPINPSKQQLDALFAGPRSSEQRALVLKTDGLFYLVDEEILYTLENDPELVVMFNMPEGNADYAAPVPFSKWTEDPLLPYYILGVDYWLLQLLIKRLHRFCNRGTEFVDVDDLLEALIRLRDLERNWECFH